KDMVPASIEGGDVRGDVIHLHRSSETIVFHGIKERPVPSLLRGFSAPVNLSAPLSDDDRAFLALNDSDPVARWQALTGISSHVLLDGSKRVRVDHPPAINERNVVLAGKVASDDALGPASRALCLTLPTESDIAREIGSNVDPDAILASRNHFIDAIAARYADDFAKLYDALKQDGAFSPDADAAGKRALRNALLDYLSRHEKSQQRAADQ